MCGISMMNEKNSDENRSQQVLCNGSTLLWKQQQHFFHKPPTKNINDDKFRMTFDL